MRVQAQKAGRADLADVGCREPGQRRGRRQVQRMPRTVTGGKAQAEQRTIAQQPHHSPDPSAVRARTPAGHHNRARLSHRGRDPRVIVWGPRGRPPPAAELDRWPATQTDSPPPAVHNLQLARIRPRAAPSDHRSRHPLSTGSARSPPSAARSPRRAPTDSGTARPRSSRPLDPRHHITSTMPVPPQDAARAAAAGALE